MRFILFFLPLISISVYSMDIKISKNIWEFTPDGVMGGKSKGSIQFLNTEGFDYISSEEMSIQMEADFLCSDLK